MLRFVRAEHLKLKHSFGAKIALLAPILCLLLVGSLNGGLTSSMPAGAWNWWYTMLLPAMLAILCGLVIKRDRNLHFHNLLCLPAPMEKSWISKFIYCCLGLFFSNLILFAGTLFCGTLAETSILPSAGLLAVVLLTITHLWEIPFYLFLSARFGLILSVLAGVLLPAISVFAIADRGYWWIFPTAIPTRLMCPALGLLPNGLPTETGSPLLDAGVILPGILISLGWLAVLLIVTARWFRRLEAK